MTGIAGFLLKTNKYKELVILAAKMTASTVGTYTCVEFVNNKEIIVKIINVYIRGKCALKCVILNKLSYILKFLNE